MTIFWILYGGYRTGSSRIHGYQIHNYLRKCGYSSRILVSPPGDVVIQDLSWHDPSRLCRQGFFQVGDTVIFGTVRGPHTLALAEQLHRIGVRVVFVDADLHTDTDIVPFCDEVICSSLYLAEVYSLRHNRHIQYIPDAVEFTISSKVLSKRTRSVRQNLLLAWIGVGAHWDTLRELRDLLQRDEFKDMHLVTVSEHPSADVRWTVSAGRRILQACDAVVIPTSSSPEAKAKSNNRVTQAMAMGVPVLAGRIPAYEEIIDSGKNGFLCKSSLEWVDGLRELRDPALRSLFARRGWELVQDRYTLPAIGQRWIDVLAVQPSKSTYRAMVPLALRMEEWDAYLRELLRRRFAGRRIYAVLQRIYRRVRHRVNRDADSIRHV